MKAAKIFSIERIVELESGVLCRLHIDLFDVGKGKFLESIPSDTEIIRPSKEEDALGRETNRQHSQKSDSSDE